MKTRLKRFTSFANQLLPHEVRYLQDIQQFEDEDNLAILNLIAYNSPRLHHPKAYDESIDKRKYSRFIKWVNTRLSAIDVDAQFEWITQLERKIMTDSVQPEEEQQLLRYLKKYSTPIYYFMKFYELLQHYSQYLLVRIRHKDYREVQHFLETYAENYQQSKQTYEQLHHTTVDIVKQYTDSETETRKWEPWLNSIFNDEQMDGMNRYFAAIRLTFIYLNYRDDSKLLRMYESLDEMFRRGLFYSRRILVNYYSNRLLLHSRLGDLEQAVVYGYLSVRHKNADYLQYVNNLCAVLLRQGRKVEALDLMQQAIPEVRSTKSFHNKVGSVAFYMRCLNENAQSLKAEKCAETFLRGYKDEVFEQRWHLFFSTYIQALIMQEKYDKVLRIVHRYRIMDKEKMYRRRTTYLPTLSWYYALAAYKEGKINEEVLQNLLLEGVRNIRQNEHTARLIRPLIRELQTHIPLTMKKINSPHGLDGILKLDCQ